MNIVAIIQARMNSSRLPGKVLLDIAGQPMLAHVVERTRLARMVDQVVVATTIDPSDDLIEALCRERAYPYCRGSLYDVLDRYYQAARLFNADVVVRITADCPLIDPGVVDKTVSEFLGIRKYESGKPSLTPNSQLAIPYDFAANRLPPPWGRTYPIGLDTEACTFSALELAWREATQPHQREHVMPFFYDQPQRFRIMHVNHEIDYGALRWTVDTPEDLELVRQIFTRFPDRRDFSWLEVLALFESEPELAQVNAQINAKDYRQVDARRGK
jgi:spore coat polysaccharide biosynthesis protein SpsF